MVDRVRRSAGIREDLRNPLPWPSSEPFRILSIDGGGIKGILPAKFLAEIEQKFLNGKSAGNYFDLIAGTSTGGIIALGLSVGIPASKILDLYLQNGRMIFPPIEGPLRHLDKAIGKIRNTVLYTYDSSALRQALQATFEDRTIGDAIRRLCVPTFDDNTEINVIKTPHHPDFKIDWEERMVDVALKTSAAPSYFRPHMQSGARFMDGGVWANNPVMVALVDALTSNDVRRTSVQILSLGCSESLFKITPVMLNWGGLLFWREIISAAMNLQSQSALGQAGLLIGRNNLHRIDGASQGKPIKLDDFVRAASELPSLASELADRHGTKIFERFFSKEAIPFRAFHGPRAAVE